MSIEAVLNQQSALATTMQDIQKELTDNREKVQQKLNVAARLALISYSHSFDVGSVAVGVNYDSHYDDPQVTVGNPSYFDFTTLGPGVGSDLTPPSSVTDDLSDQDPPPPGSSSGNYDGNPGNAYNQGVIPPSLTINNWNTVQQTPDQIEDNGWIRPINASLPDPTVDLSGLDPISVTPSPGSDPALNGGMSGIPSIPYDPNIDLSTDLMQFDANVQSSSKQQLLGDYGPKEYDFSQFDTYVSSSVFSEFGVSSSAYDAPYLKEAHDLFEPTVHEDPAGLLSIDNADPDIIASAEPPTSLPLPGLSDDAERAVISSAEAIRQHQIDNAEFQRQQDVDDQGWGDRESLKLLSVPLVSVKGIAQGLVNDGKQLAMQGLQGFVYQNGLTDVLPDSVNQWIFSPSTPVFDMDDRSVENAGNIGFKAVTLLDAATTLLPKAPDAIRSIASWFDTTSEVTEGAEGIPEILGDTLGSGSAMSRAGLELGLDAGTLTDSFGQIVVNAPKIDIAAPEIRLGEDATASVIELPEVTVGAEPGISPAELELSRPSLAVNDVADIGTVEPGVAQIPWGACFLPGTPIHTKFVTKPIEEIEAGDWVAARNQYSNETTWRQVLQTFASKDKDVVHVRVEHADGSHETISATTEHPFYVTGKGWSGANALQAGDLLELLEGGRSRVAGVLPDGGKYSVHNFEVEHDHTYFVGGRGVWVHNTSSVADALREVGETPNTVTANVGKNSVTWMMDSDGNTLSASGTLRESFSGATRSSAEVQAQADAAASGVAGDQGGHLVGHRFVLDQGSVNLFPQEGNFNMSAFKTLENDYARYTSQGYQVDFSHTLGDFDPLTGRPGSLSVNYEVTDGSGNIIDTFADKFLNQSGQVYVRRAQ